MDYKDVPSAEEFARLSDGCKQILAAEAVPAHTIFTNEQLAAMAQAQAAARVWGGRWARDRRQVKWLARDAQRPGWGRA